MAEPHEPATVDAFARGFLAVVFAMFSALGGWLWARVNRNHDARIKHGERLDKLDSRVEETRAQVRDAVRDLADKAVTPECVREVIDEALDRRDRVRDTRRAPSTAPWRCCSICRAPRSASAGSPSRSS